MKKIRYGVAWIIAIFIPFMVITILAKVNNTNSNDNISSDKSLQKMINQINKNLPKMVNKETRLDIVTREHKTLIYKYTVVNYTSMEVKPNYKIKERKKELSNVVCKVAEKLLINGVTMKYQYYGNDSNIIDKIIINYIDCNY